MISVEEARERILTFFERLGPEPTPVIDALGQVLAEDILADFDIPPLDNTAMDGYAVRAADTENSSESSPKRLTVIADLAAGYVLDTSVSNGQAVRIMTGAPIPPGADAIVPFEETDEPLREPGEAPTRGDTVGVFKEALTGANIRRQGEDIKAGQVVLKAGREMRPSEIGVLSSIGQTEVSVYRRPEVAILSTGDEIVKPGENRRKGQIYDANAHSVAALVKAFGGQPRLLGIAQDTVEDLTEKIHSGLDADMIVTSAGVSRGDFDVVKDVLAREGAIDFWTVRMKPGKPLAFGAFKAPDGRRVPHLGLPGNPVSSMVAFELFGRPAIFKMLGRVGWERPVVKAITRDPVVNTDARRFFARCIVTKGEDGRYYADLTGPQGSGILTSMSAANGLTVIPEDLPRAEPGDEIDVMMIDWEQPG
ncbi:MAG: molybdopterin molybdenumtransferase MoeA [Dehalococcoidia bacterium]|nr:molybdopterin molybdenumtransferase MoeA [Dehalococcoidia bacterium]|tara:strand:+ start:981 stop:2246 length:1266 start_codon:yes stop_codon:yes gene_type:complete